MAQPKLSQVTTSAFVNFRGARAFCWLEGERNFSDFRSLLPFPRSGNLEPRRAVERGQMLAGASPVPCFDLAPHGVWERFFQGWVGGGRALAGERQGEEREAAHTSRWCLTALGPSGAGQEGHHAQDSLSGCRLALSPASGMDRACHTEEDCVTCCWSAKCTLCGCKYPRAKITDPSLPPTPLTSTPARCEGGSQGPCMNPAHARVTGAPFTPHHPLKAEVIRPWT